MTIMTINAVIAPIPLMTKPHHGRSIILSFTKVAKRFRLRKFSSKKLRIRPSSFLYHKVVCINCTDSYGRLRRFRKMLFASCVFYECYTRATFSMNAIREPRFLWMLFASHVFYGSVRNSADLLMTVVFMSSAKGVAICDGGLSSSSTCFVRGVSWNNPLAKA